MVSNKVEKRVKIRYGEWIVKHANCVIWRTSTVVNGRFVKFLYCNRHKEMFDCERNEEWSVCSNFEITVESTSTPSTFSA